MDLQNTNGDSSFKSPYRVQLLGKFVQLSKFRRYCPDKDFVFWDCPHQVQQRLAGGRVGRAEEMPTVNVPVRI